MVSKASAKHQRLSPRKARVIINLVRGREAAEALQLLEYTTKAGAPVVKKLIASAWRMPSRKPQVDADSLFISRATVDKAPAGSANPGGGVRAMGRATKITKGNSHIHIELDER
jgi:large subunit ribosomal protein L22